MPRPIVDLIGKRFGRLVVIEITSERKRKYVVWKAYCDCGNVAFVVSHELVHGRTQSCGCLRTELLKKNQYRSGRPKHGYWNTPTYSTWRAMLNRCSNPCVNGYEYYGGRGIVVCNQWRDFENFLHDMGQRPSLQHSIDRIDPDGNYEPSNCCWATSQEQARNRRISKRKVGSK